MTRKVRKILRHTVTTSTERDLRTHLGWLAGSQCRAQGDLDVAVWLKAVAVLLAVT